MSGAVRAVNSSLFYLFPLCTFLSIANTKSAIRMNELHYPISRILAVEYLSMI